MPPPSVELNYGVPNHFKNLCDAAHGHLCDALSQACKTRVVSDIDQMIVHCRALYEEYAADPKRAGRIPATFVNYWPDAPRAKFVDEYCLSWTSSSFKEPISVSQSWSIRLNDNRRRGNEIAKKIWEEMGSRWEEMRRGRRWDGNI